MKRLWAILVMATLVVAMAMTGSALADNGNRVNFGGCIAATDSPNLQAPGQTGNGPLVIVVTPNGEIIHYANFTGGVGCAH